MNTFRARRSICLILSVFGVCVTTKRGYGQTSDSLSSLAARAGYIFTGVVRNTNAVAMPSAPRSANTIVVDVTDVETAPRAVGNLRGQQITVYLKDPATLKEGSRATFFAEGWLAGDGIAVRELAHFVSPQPDGQTAQAFVAANRSAENVLIKQRIVSADLVIRGRVTSSRLALRKPAPIEHDPEWREAIVAVEAVVKGEPATASVTVLYPGSHDVMWVDAPRFPEGTRGVFILRARESAVLRFFPEPIGDRIYTALNRNDFQPADRESMIRSLSQR